MRPLHRSYYKIKQRLCDMMWARDLPGKPKLPPSRIRREPPSPATPIGE